MQEKVRRGPSGASKSAARYLEKHPFVEAKDLAKKFDLDPSTIYRAPWWKNRKAVAK